MNTSLLSVQLYTVREALAEDLAGTLARIARIGFVQVEPYDFMSFGPALGDGLAAAGLTTPTTHMSFIGKDPAPIFAAASRLGIATVIDPWTDPSQWATRDDVAGVAREFDVAARIAADHGIRIGYHNHAHELEHVLDGTTALEVFADLVDPSVVLEVDTYWAAVGGQDPVALVRRLGGRVHALHLKDGPFSADTKDQVPLGQGRLPVREIIEAAPHALRVVELDDSAGDRFEAIEESLGYLTGEGLA